MFILPSALASDINDIILVPGFSYTIISPDAFAVLPIRKGEIIVLYLPTMIV